LGTNEPQLETLNVLLHDLSVADIDATFDLKLFIFFHFLYQFTHLLRVNELTSNSVWAVLIFMILLTKFGLISRWNMLLFLKLMLSMRKGTRWSVWAALFLDPALAKLSFYLKLVVFRYYSAIALECKWILNILILSRWSIVGIGESVVIWIVISAICLGWLRLLPVLLIALVGHPDTFGMLVVLQEVVLVIYLILQTAYLSIYRIFLIKMVVIKFTTLIFSVECARIYLVILTKVDKLIT